VAIKAALQDPGQVLRDWDHKSGDPCRWNMVTCHGGHVQELYALTLLVVLVFLCCHNGQLRLMVSLLHCSQVHGAAEPLRHTVAGDWEAQVSAVSVSLDLKLFSLLALSGSI
jgi:hypothetical protein